MGARAAPWTSRRPAATAFPKHRKSINDEPVRVIEGTHKSACGHPPTSGLVHAAGDQAQAGLSAINLIIASARGAVLTLVGMPEDTRDLGMLDDILDGLISTVTTETRASRSFEIPQAANVLRAALRQNQTDLSPGELALLDELLVRLTEQADSERPAQ